ncbi:adenylosuccinate synthase [Candidatus Micrarchaeota archaeon]|nr:adenylosuccinate synthase [Candidatus Micrarchaeota archaeon]
MTVTVIIGMQWGDEAKGKIVDLLAKDYDYIVRFNGGDNAGHTIKADGKKFGLHLIPSGVFFPEKFKVIGNGVVVNPETLLREIDEVEKAGYSMKNLIISDSAHIILPWHKELDGIEDGKNALGTTKRGIGPVYMDKASRLYAIRIGDLFYEKELKVKLENIAKVKEGMIKLFGKSVQFNTSKILDSLIEFRTKIGSHIKNTALLLSIAAKSKNILLEGAQATFLDVDHGTYPFVTSSNTTVGAACVGSGIPPKKISRVIGIVKAYTTRVGTGPFPTELLDSTGEQLRKAGAEFGTTTGRPRRCGWLDLVMLKTSVAINGTDDIVITKIDVLDGLDEIKVCTSYEIDGKKTEEFPTGSMKLPDVKPVYKTFKCWGKLTETEWANIRKTKKLPSEMKTYLDFISKELGVKISMVSYGPERDQTIFL